MPALVNNLLHYLRVYRRLVYISLMNQLEYRLNFVTWNLINFLWFAASWGFATIVFGQIETIAGWDKPRVLLLYAVISLYNDFMWMLIMDNMYDFSHYVRHGRLDYLLVKPLSARFLTSFGSTDLTHFPRIIFIMWFIYHQLQIIGVYPNLGGIVLAIILFLSGVMTFYSLIFAANTTGIWFVRLFNITDIFDTVANIGRYPIEIFKNQARFFLTYLVPAAFIAYLPVKALIGEGQLTFLPIGLLVAGLSLALSGWFWRFALKFYSSAST